MFTIRTARTSSSTSDACMALRIAISAARQGCKPTLHQFGGRTLSLNDLSAMAGMSAVLGLRADREWH